MASAQLGFSHCWATCRTCQLLLAGWTENPSPERFSNAYCGKKAGLAARSFARWNTLLICVQQIKYSLSSHVHYITPGKHVFILYRVFLWLKSEKILHALVSNSSEGKWVFILIYTFMKLTVSLGQVHIWKFHAGNLKSLLVKANIINTFRTHILNLQQEIPPPC